MVSPKTRFCFSWKTATDLCAYSNTCRRRKVKCDGATPDCANCIKLQLACEKPTVDYRFLIHTNQPFLPDPRTPLPARSCDSHEHRAGPTNPGAAEDLRLRQAVERSQLSPRAALEDSAIAHFFSHYVKTIAPWYDLNDATNTFSSVVTARALDFPVLFRAIIALSSSHWSKVMGGSREIPFAFHAACVQDLLGALDDSSNFPGEYLAAACLLQLYEILNESLQSSLCHLLGAYSFSTAIHINLSTWNFPQAGFWNYLREEITVGLASNRPVRIGKDFPRLRDTITRETLSDDMRANLITYILARIMNLYFACREARAQGDSHPWPDEPFATRTDLETDFKLWTENLPTTFQPYSTAPKPGNIFPSEWMLKPWHVSALQYAAIAEMLLILSSPGPQTGSSILPNPHNQPPDLVQKLTVRVCGLAFTNEDLAATLNAFGPLSFCGQYLTEDGHRTALETMLVNFSKPTGYPIEHNIKQLKEWWAESSCV